MRDVLHFIWMPFGLLEAGSGCDKAMKSASGKATTLKGGAGEQKQQAAGGKWGEAARQHPSCTGASIAQRRARPVHSQSHVWVLQGRPACRHLAACAHSVCSHRRVWLPPGRPACRHLAARAHSVRGHGRGWLLRHRLHGLQVPDDLLKPGNVAHQEVAWGQVEGTGRRARSAQRGSVAGSSAGARRLGLHPGCAGAVCTTAGRTHAQRQGSRQVKEEQGQCASPLTTLALGSATTTISSPSCCSMLRV